jgi:hypothetical protein
MGTFREFVDRFPIRKADHTQKRGDSDQQACDPDPSSLAMNGQATVRNPHAHTQQHKIGE